MRSKIVFLFIKTLDNQNELWYCVVLKKGCDLYGTKRLLTNGNAFKRTDNRWCGVVWYMDERGVRKRKSFSGTTKQAVNKKITDYIADFNESIIESEETKKTLRESMQKWLGVFKFPSVERSTYDRYECTAKHQIYPILGDKVVSDISATYIKDLLNQKMSEGYAYTTVKKVYVVLGEYFRYLTQQEIIVKHPSYFYGTSRSITGNLAPILHSSSLLILSELSATIGADNSSAASDPIMIAVSPIAMLSIPVMSTAS